MPPVRETQNGPNLSCSRPATTNVSANTTTAMVNTLEVSALFQPNSFSSGATNTLQAYSVPRARFMDIPPTTRHQRLMPGLPDSVFALATVFLLIGKNKFRAESTSHFRQRGGSLTQSACCGGEFYSPTTLFCRRN